MKYGVGRRMLLATLSNEACFNVYLLQMGVSLALPGEGLHLTYEGFASNTSATLESLLHFLGLPLARLSAANRTHSSMQKRSAASGASMLTNADEVAAWLRAWGTEAGVPLEEMFADTNYTSFAQHEQAACDGLKAVAYAEHVSAAEATPFSLKTTPRGAAHYRPPPPKPSRPTLGRS